MQFCQGSAPSPALLFTGMKKGTEHFSAVHIVLRCLKELLKSMWGGGRAKRNHRRGKGRDHMRGESQKHIYNPGQSAQPIPQTPQHCSLPPFQAVLLQGWAPISSARFENFNSIIGLLDTSLVKQFVHSAPSIKCLPKEQLHYIDSFFPPRDFRHHMAKALWMFIALQPPQILHYVDQSARISRQGCPQGKSNA